MNTLSSVSKQSGAIHRDHGVISPPPARGLSQPRPGADGLPNGHDEERCDEHRPVPAALDLYPIGRPD